LSISQTTGMYRPVIGKVGKTKHANKAKHNSVVLKGICF